MQHADMENRPTSWAVWRRFSLVLVLAVSVSACETAGDIASAANPLNWFGDDEEVESTEPKPVPGSSDAFPSVGGVPQKPPPPSILEEQASLQNQLVADKANAQYTDQQIRQTQSAAAAAVPQPAQTARAVPQPARPQPAPVPQPTVARAAPQPVPAPAAAAPAPAPAAPSAPAPALSQPVGQAVHIATLYFPAGGSLLTQNDLNVLSQVAGIYRNGGKAIRVVGHASKATGTSQQQRQDLVNYKASLDRATSAAAALLRIGIPQDKIEVAAVGAREPRFSEDTAAGVSGNQRVEVFIQY